jgi:hypothetical protein
LVIDVSNPGGPHQLGSAFFPGTANGIAVVGDFVYVGSRQGLQVIDVSDPQSPRLVGWYAKQCGEVVVSGGLAYTPGLDIFEFLGEGVEETPNAEVHATKCLPTITRGVLVLSRDMTELPGTSDRVPRPSLLDAVGREVMNLKPGANDVRALAPGVYFVRQASSVEHQASSVIKVVVTR